MCCHLSGTTLSWKWGVICWRTDVVTGLSSLWGPLAGTWWVHGSLMVNHHGSLQRLAALIGFFPLIRGKCSEKFLGFSFDLEEMFTWFPYRPDQTRWILGSDSVPKVGSFSPQSKPRFLRNQGCKDFAANDICCRCFTWAFDIMICRVWGGHFLVQHNFHSQNSSRDDVIADTNQCGW